MDSRTTRRSARLRPRASRLPSSRSRLSLALGLGLVVGAGSACVDDRLPDDVSCGAVLSAGASPAALVDALAKAAAGDCVLLEEREYRGAFRVPSAVKLVGVPGATLVGDDVAEAALVLAGGEGSGAFALEVSSAAGEGLRVEEGPARIADVSVRSADEGAVVLTCEASCGDPANAIALDDVRTSESRFGVWARGAVVRVEGGESRAHGGDALSAGYGVIASDGADLRLAEHEVSNNDAVGVLVDGEDTRATLTDVQVTDNAGRGVYAQGLRGNVDEPALLIEGASTALERNGVVGLGSVDARGIIFVNGRVAETVAKPIPTDLGSVEEVGDGVGLFAGSGDVRLDGVALADSARAQLLVDQGQVGIIFVNGTITGEVKAVIQDTDVAVEVPEELLSDVGERLGIDAARLRLPAAQ